MDAPTQVIRSTMTDTTSLDYLYGTLLSIGLLFSLLFPKFRQALVSETQESQAASDNKAAPSTPAATGIPMA